MRHPNPCATTPRTWPTADPQPRRRPRIELISNGVVATYLHDISARHRRRDPSPLPATTEPEPA